MAFDLANEFAHYLRGKGHLAAGIGSIDQPTQAQDERTLRKLWELTELSANDFADEVSRFFKVPRVSLPDLLAAPPLVKQFSRRFLREMLVFPYQGADGNVVLAVGDPSDSAAVRAAGIVLGGDIKINLASFEDITTALNQRLG
jgi:general secretion pathway protein E